MYRARRLQAATSAKHSPILLRVSFHEGHGVSSSLSDRVDESVDVLAFLYAHLGMTYKAPARLK